MPGIGKRITPLKLAVAYQLFIIFYLIKSNINEPSVEGWADIFAVVLFAFALIILAVDAILVQYVKNKTAFWITQIVLSSLLVWLFINEGLPGRL